MAEAQLQKPSSLRFPHCFKSRPTRSVTRVAFGRERGENKCQGVVFAFQKKRKRAKPIFFEPSSMQTHNKCDSNFVKREKTSATAVTARIEPRQKRSFFSWCG